MSGMSGGRKYGVQVGNETYSLVLTQEDWEKRRLDREHVRKLSLANNKRRKALDDRKRVAEARENRKRELELFKRRQRQIEATERYQRFHVSAKDKRVQNSDFVQSTPNLEEVLQKLRGGDGDSFIGTTPGTEKVPVTTYEASQKSVSDDQPPRPVVMERAEWQNMKEYAEELKRQILGVKYTPEAQAEDKAQNGCYVDDDGQDSLHGSSISGSSQPSCTSPNLAQGHPESVTKPQNEFFKKANKILQEANIHKTQIPNSQNAPSAQNQNEIRPPQDQQNDLAIICGSESGVMCKRDSQTGRITYYVKAYRPWSATVVNKSFHNAFHHNYTGNSLLIRPSSSCESHNNRVSASHHTSMPPKPPQRYYDTWTSSNNSDHIVQHSKKHSDATRENELVNAVSKTMKFSNNAAALLSEPQLPHTHQRQASSAPIARTTATPVSPFFDNARESSGGMIITSPLPPPPASTSAGETANRLATSESGTRTTVTVSYSQSSVAPVSIVAKKVLSELDANEKHTSEKIEKFREKKEGALKGILRQYSKYDSTMNLRYSVSMPAYQSARIAREKWLHGINLGPPPPEPTRELRVRSAETTKSVRWHQVQYNDGSPSSALDVHENVPSVPEAPTLKPQPPTRVQGVSSARGVRTPRKPSAARPKTSPARGMRGGKIKSSGRRLKPAKELPVNIIPHPPPQKQDPKLSMSTVINYSIDPGEETVSNKEYEAPNGKTVPLKQRSSSTNKRMPPFVHNKIVYRKAENEAVTMSTLKSRGNETRPYDSGRDPEGVVVNQGNQVTINVSSSKPIVRTPCSTRQAAVVPGRIPLNGIPTDQEIEMLWDKVRSYLAWNKSRGNSPLVKKIRATPERKVAWGAPPPETPTKHVSANIISIDGGIFHKPSNGESVPTSTQSNSYKTPHQMPVHYERFGITKSRKVAYAQSVQPQDYSYFANHGPQFQMREKVRGAMPVVSNVHGHGHPSSAPVRRQPQLTESVRTFRLVEALIEQNVPEEEILRALNSLQSATREVY